MAWPRSNTSLEKIQGCPDATRLAPLRLTRTVCKFLVYRLKQRGYTDCVTLIGMAVIRLLTRFLPLTCLLVPGLLTAQAPQFTIQDFGTLPGLASCSGTALSQSGNVVGYCTAVPVAKSLLLSSPATHVFLILQRRHDGSERHLPNLGLPHWPSTTPELWSAGP